MNDTAGARSAVSSARPFRLVEAAGHHRSCCPVSPNPDKRFDSIRLLDVIVDLLHRVADALGQQRQFFVETGIVHLEHAFVIVE